MGKSGQCEKKNFTSRGRNLQPNNVMICKLCILLFCFFSQRNIRKKKYKNVIYRSILGGIGKNSAKGHTQDIGHRCFLYRPLTQ